MEETKLIKRLRKHDTEALEMIIDRYSAYVQTIVYNIIGQSMTIEDIEETCSDIFLIIWNQADDIQPGKLKAYIGSISRNRALAKLREIRKTVPLEFDEIMEIPEEKTTEDRILENELIRSDNLLINMLKDEEKEIFIRHYYYCQTIGQIEDEMGIKASTIKSKLKRGREKLKAILDDNEMLISEYRQLQ